jgi:hypothetical protein
MVNTSVSAFDIKQKLEVYKDKIVSAIDKAAAKQKDKYNSLNLQ